MTELEKTEMNPNLIHWVVSLFVVVVAAGTFGSMDLEEQRIAEEMLQEREVVLQAEMQEKQAIEQQKIALYGQAQYLTGFGGLPAVSLK